MQELRILEVGFLDIGVQFGVDTVSIAVSVFADDETSRLVCIGGPVEKDNRTFSIQSGKKKLSL